VPFDTASLDLLRGIATAGSKPKVEPIVLGRATADDGSLRRPEYFSVGDIASFEAHESALTAAAAISASDEQVFLAAVRGLPEAARALLCVPVFPADMARNHRLHVLKVLHERQTTMADNIIIKGTVLSNDRETEEQRAEDRERAAASRHTAQGDFVKGGPHICVVVELDGERVSISGFVATCPARIESVNGVQQNSKVRTTTDKSWPKLGVLSHGSDELVVNPHIALHELPKSEFPKT
jgi:hypothetical protein